MAFDTRPLKEAISVQGDGDVAIVTFDLPGEKVNKFSTPVMMRLKEIIEELNRSSFKAVVFFSAKSKIFIAGADIDEIKVMKTKEEFDASVKGGQDIMNMVEDLKIPSLAAVHGACVGGGCEFIMSCDYRMATDDNSTKIGLPEIQLGIIPGFGGCVRMPRIIGLQAALDIILAGKTVPAKKALKVGLIDRMVHPGILREEALKWARQIVKDGGAKRYKKFHAKGVMGFLMEGPLKGLVFSQARKMVLKNTKGKYPAPLAALDTIRKTYGMSDRQKALNIERAHFCECGISEISKNLIHVFGLTEMVKKSTGVHGDVKGRDVKRMGILGAGTMGGGIAYQAADKGIEVRMKDVNAQALGKGLAHASELWSKLLKRKSIDKYQFKQKMDLISTTTDYSGFKTLDLVVEAIIEDVAIKQKVVGETAAQMRPDAILATNTSSLSVTEIAKGHPRPEYFAGMHFFNPVNKMPLVEVIRGEKSSDETVATVFELAKKMGKMPVVVKDGPGFLVNRLLLPYMAEAAWLFQEGMSIDVVDKAFVNDFGMPMGPFALMDEVGLDVCMKVLKIFKKSFPDRVEIAGIMDKLEASDRKGKKNGKGFYLYEGDKRKEVDPAIYTALGVPAPKNPWTTTECIERGVYAMVNECSRALLDDHIVEKPDEVDLAMIMGTGFPPFRGGLLKYADKVGPKVIAEALEKYSTTRSAKRLKPADALKKTNQFYGG